MNKLINYTNLSVMNKFWKITIYIGLPFSIIGTIVCICVIFHCTDNLSFNCIDVIIQFIKSNSISLLTFIANCVIAIYAYKAFNQSIKARRYASFESVFSQMITIQRDFFDNSYISKTILKGKCKSRSGHMLKIKLKSRGKRVNLNRYSPLTKSFVNYYIQITNLYKDEFFSDSDIILIWRQFVKNIEYEEYFNNCFKYIYNVVTWVDKSDVLKNDKIRYIERVQALLNKNELFCYLINLISYYYENGIQDDEYLKLLQKAGFFGDLSRSKTFSGMMKNIPKDILNRFMNSGS